MKIGQTALTTIAAVPSPVKMTALDSCSSNTYQTKISKLATKIKTQVLVSARGSGSDGELGTPSFYIIDKLPMEFHNNLSTKLEAIDIDIGENRKAFYIDSVLTHDEADVLAACAEAILEDNGHSRLAPGIHTPPGMRINEAAHWYPSQTLEPKFLGKIYDRIRHLIMVCVYILDFLKRWLNSNITEAIDSIVILMAYFRGKVRIKKEQEWKNGLELFPAFR